MLALMKMLPAICRRCATNVVPPNHDKSPYLCSDLPYHCVFCLHHHNNAYGVYVSQEGVFLFCTEWVLCQVEALSLQVSGAFPTWLHGDYVRNGPGTFKGMDHLFDGYGMLVKFSFDNGKVSTQQRYASLASPKKPECSACQAEMVECHLCCMPCLAETRLVKWLVVAQALMAMCSFISLTLWQAVFAQHSALLYLKQTGRSVHLCRSVHELEDCSD